MLGSLRPRTQLSTDGLGAYIWAVGRAFGSAVDYGMLIKQDDKAENEYSLQHGFRILSSYKTAAGEKLWVITEADRSVTLLLPEEY